MKLNQKEYRSKVLGCWLGKNIGGTVGAPFEWKRQINDISFYVQDLKGEPLPNDDLDIQLLWLVALEEMGLDLDAHILAEYWCMYVTPHWSEYGTAKVNMRSGLQPPLSGSVNNDYKDSCGAFIRSEIWACIAPGLPKVAAQYAYHDAILDHGDGEGTYAEVFCAALESAAFAVSDLRKLIEIGLSYIPEGCGVAAAVNCAIACVDRGVSWQEARNEILEKHRGSSFLNNISEEDRERGFDVGKLGYDVPSNIAILVLGLLLGEGDFEKTMCITVNCGEDTDCTAATAGSIFGIIHGVDAIPQRWIEPIGRNIKTACLNLGELGFFGNQLPSDVDNMTERTSTIAAQLLLRHRKSGMAFTENDTEITPEEIDRLYAGDWMEKLYADIDGPACSNRFYTASVRYEDGPFIRDGEEKRLSVKVSNTYKTQSNLTLRCYAPSGWQLSPEIVFAQLLPEHMGDAPVVTFAVTMEQVPEAINRAVVEITAAGRPLVMHVPITLVNGNGRSV